MLAFARALGEYGSVIFIAGNMPMQSEITPLLIMIKLEQYDYAGATAIALVFLLVSFALLLLINFLAWHRGRRLRAAEGESTHDGRRGLGPAARGRAPGSVAASAALTEPRRVRWLLLGTALIFLGFFLFVPLALVFTKALGGGLAGLSGGRSASPWRSPPSASP